MAERFDLGGAAFHLVISSAEFNKGLAKAEADARAASQKIAAALSGAGRGGAAIAPKVDNTQAIKAYQDIAVAAKAAQTAGNFTATPKVNTQQAQSGVSGLAGGLKQLFALGAGAAGVTLGVAAIGQAISGSIEAAQEARQAQLALNATYGEGAAQFTKFADAQAAALGKSNVEFKQAAVVTATLNRNYGLTAEQIQNVIKRSTDLAAIQGLGVVDATKRVSDAIRGEAEAAELLGLTLNSDAIKAIAEMTDEQRKNFETLDALTKAQITYREFLRQTAFAEGAAAKAAADGTTAYDQAGASFKNLGVEAGKATDPIGKGLAGAFRVAADAAADYIKTIRSDITQIRPPGTEAPVIGANDDIEARRAAQAEARRIARGKQAAEDAIRARAEAKTLGDIAREAEQEKTKDALEGIDERRRAAAKAAADAREQITDSRDAEIAQSQVSQQAELRALDATAQARARARTQEDRARSDAQAAELRGLEQVHNANLQGLEEQAAAIDKRRDEAVKGIDAEIRAVDRKRDAATRAIDEETRAESRRHSEALRNIDRERDAKLGIIDEQLRALDAAALKDQRRQTDLSLARTLADAKRDLKSADTPDERARARRAIADAEEAIRREQVNRQREDQRAFFQAQAEQVRAAADAAKQIEDARNQTATDSLGGRKQALQDQAQADTERLQAVKGRVEEESKIEADSIKARIDAEKVAYDQTVQDARDSFEQINRAVADSRQAQDDALASRRQGVQDHYAAEQTDIKATADVKLKALEQNTADTATELDKEKKVWTDWREHVEKEIAAAILAGDPEKIRKLGTSPASGENAGRGPGEPPSRDEAASNLTATAKAIAEGLADGISSEGSRQAVSAATQELIEQGVVKAAKDTLGIASPSRVFEEMAREIPPGFVQGLAGAEDIIGPAMVKVFDNAWANYLQPWFTGENGLQTQLGVHFGAAAAGLDSEATEAAFGRGMFLALQGGYEQSVIPWFTASDGVGAQLGAHFATAVGHLNSPAVQRAAGDAMHAALTAGFNLTLSRQKEWWPGFEQLGQNLAISVGNGFTSWWNSHPLQAPTASGGTTGFASTTSGTTASTGVIGSRGGGQLAYDGLKFGQNDVEAYLVSKGYTPGTSAFNQLFDQLFAYQAKGYGPPPDMTVTGRAMGGTIKPGDWSWVGEQGPELVRAGASGVDVRSNRDSMAMVGAARGAAGPVNVNVDLRGSVIREEADIDRLANAIGDRQRAELDRVLGSGQRFPYGISRSP